MPFFVSSEPVGGIPHETLLIFILQVALLLGLARTLGLLAQRMKLPAVVGELLAGLILGPSILGAIAPGLEAALFPAEAAQVHLLEVVSFLGVVLLLVLTGLETDVALIRAKGRTAAMVSAGGIVVPFALGMALGYAIPVRYVADPNARLTFALFLGTAMSISAIPVIAKVLIELKVIRRDIGQLTLAAGMIDDTVGWIMLSIVAGLASTGSVEAAAVGRSIGVVLGFLAFAAVVGSRLAAGTVKFVAARAPGDGPVLSTLIVLALLFAGITQWLNIEAVLGAFVLGIVASRIRRIDHHLIHTLEVVTLSVFAPIFFASTGLKVDLSALVDPEVLLIAVLALAVAIAGKFVGAYVGASAAGLGRWEALSLGAGMNARGALEIIIASIGLSLGVLTGEMFTVIVLVAIVTSLMAPPILRVTLPRIPMSDQERTRLESEARAKSSLLGSVHRVLLPTRGGTNSQLAAQVLARMIADTEVEVTLLGIDEADDRRFDVVEPHLGPDADVRRVVRSSAGKGDDGNAAQTILAELAAGGYDLLVVGATETRVEEDPESALFSSMVDKLLQEVSVPLLLVSSRYPADVSGPIPPLVLDQILLPTTGDDVNRRAAEVAFEIAEAGHTPVDIVHVVRPPSDAWVPSGGLDVRTGADVRTTELAEEIVAEEARLGLALGAMVHTEVVVSDDELDEVVIERAVRTGASLIVMRSDVQPVTRRAFLGHAVDRILRDAPCPVVVITRT